MAKTLNEAGVKRLIQEIKGANKNLNTPIPISTDNTTESKAQNVKNIADYVEKAKAAGIANVDGMGVTCIIDGNYSGAGYLYGEDMICGITTYNDLATPYNFAVQSDGLYIDNPFIVKGTTGQVTSSMLATGARKPIILTDDTTEVDEETYQKLLSDDVDVVFKVGGSPLYLHCKESSGNDISLRFGYIATRPISAEFPYGYSVIVQIIVTISSATPHKLVLSEPSEVAYKPDEFIEKSTITPVLQEIDLSGTDAERKAKLDQFETDWKALTGASDLNGARFIGSDSIPDDGTVITGVLSYDDGGNYVGLLYASGYTPYKAELTTDGSLTITPLFSHLEAITIYTDNTAAHKAANLANIKAYENNLKAMGVDVTKGWTAPVKVNSTNGISAGTLSSTGEESSTTYTILHGLVGEYPYIVRINKEIGETTSWSFLRDEANYSTLTTTAKTIVPAINEVNSTSVTNRADLDRTMSQVASPDDRALPLLCGQPPILFGAGTPKETVVPDNWNQYDPATGEGYNWNGKPSAIGQQYIDTTAASGGRYIAARDGEWDLKWINS